MAEPAPAGAVGRRRDLVVIGASAGGLAALRTLVGQIPADFPAPILIVLHIGTQPSILPALLTAWGRLPAAHVGGNEPLTPGRLYVAPPDHHLLVSSHSVRLSRGPKEHHTRPAIDPLFRSAALCCGPRVIGVVLSGHLDDGTAGLQAIKACGGAAVVQDPRDAQAPSMPMSALHHVDIDHCVPIGKMAQALMNLAAEPIVELEEAAPPELVTEHALTSEARPAKAIEHLHAFAGPSTLACPDCGGVLWEVNGTTPARFRCHTGHGYSQLTLVESMKESTEQALQAAFRALQEQAILLRRAASSSRAAAAVDHAAAIDADAQRAEAHARQLSLIAQEAGVRTPMVPPSSGGDEIETASEA